MSSRVVRLSHTITQPSKKKEEKKDTGKKIKRWRVEREAEPLTSRADAAVVPRNN
jgi:hypothetical protein